MTSPDFSDSLTWLEQAKTYLQQNQYIDALNCIHQGLALTPRNADAWLQCGNVLQKLGFMGRQSRRTIMLNASLAAQRPNSK